MVGDFLVVQLAIAEMEDAVGELAQVHIVRHHDERNAVLPVELHEDFHDGFSVLRVQVAGRFVEEKNVWEVDYCTSDCNALLLAARELRWNVVHATTHANTAQNAFAALAAFCRRKRPVQRERHFDIFKRCHARDEVERLKDKAQVVEAQARQLHVWRCIRNPRATHADSALGRPVDGANNV